MFRSNIWCCCFHLENSCYSKTNGIREQWNSSGCQPLARRVSEVVWGARMIEMCGTGRPKSHPVSLGRGATGVGRSCISLQLASRATWQVTKQLRAGDDFLLPVF